MLWGGEGVAAGPCDLASFHFKPADFAYLQDKYAEAQFLLRVEEKWRTTIGTGFLIHEQPLVLLTARHVVAAAESDPTVTLTGHMASLPTFALPLELLATDPTRDVALLTTAPDAVLPLDRLRPFDLNFTSKSAMSGAPVAFPGMAFLPEGVVRELAKADDGDPAALFVSPTLAEGKYSTNLTIRTEIQEGDSGAPVLLADGTVVAMVLRKTGTSLAHVVPMHELQDWLVEALVEKSTAEEVTQVLNGQLARLFHSLNPQRCRDCLTNLQLLLAARHFNKDWLDSIANDAKERLTCPVRAAMDQRGLWQSVARLDEVLVAGLGEGERELADGELLQQSVRTATTLQPHRGDLALGLLDSVEPRLVAGLEQVVSRSPERFFGTLCLEGEAAGSGDAALSALDAIGLRRAAALGRQPELRTVCRTDAGDDALAGPLQALADVQTLRGELAGGEAAADHFKRALDAASFAVLFASSPEQTARGHLTMAVAANRVEQPAVSEASLARARSAAAVEPRFTPELEATIRRHVEAGELPALATRPSPERSAVEAPGPVLQLQRDPPVLRMQRLPGDVELWADTSPQADALADDRRDALARQHLFGGVQ